MSALRRGRREQADPRATDLPPLDAHEAPSDAPKETKESKHPCRAVWTGSYTAPLACAKSLLFGKKPTGGAETLVPRRLWILILLLALPRGGLAIELPVVAESLPNGLRILLHEDHSAPVISSYVFYRSGSRNERRGQTGIAHLFEHMMFNGGKKFGPGKFDDTVRFQGAGDGVHSGDGARIGGAREIAAEPRDA